MPYNKWESNFKEQHFGKPQKNWHCQIILSRLFPCVSMKLSTFVQWSFLVIRNTSARICLNIFGDTVIQSLKVASFPCRGRENLRIYSWYSLPDSKHDQRCFIRIPSLNLPKTRHLVTLVMQFYQTIAMETMTVAKILTSVFAIYFHVL